MKPLIRLHLREKILFGFGLIMLIMLVVYAVSLNNLLKLGKASDAILKQNFLSIEATYQMLDSIEQNYRILMDVAVTNRSAEHNAMLDEQIRFDKWLSIEKGNITEKGEMESARQLEEHYKQYLEKSIGFFELSSTSTQNQYQYLSEEVKPNLLQVRKHIQDIMNINKTVMYRASENAKLIAHKATYTLIMLGLISVLLSIIISLSLSSLIVRPLKNMLAALSKVGNGDYTAQIEYHSHDELGIVSNEFNQMTKKLNDYNEMNIRNILREKIDN